MGQAGGDRVAAAGLDQVGAGGGGDLDLAAHDVADLLDVLVAGAGVEAGRDDVLGQREVVAADEAADLGAIGSGGRTDLGAVAEIGGIHGSRTISFGPSKKP